MKSSLGIGRVFAGGACRFLVWLSAFLLLHSNESFAAAAADAAFKEQAQLKSLLENTGDASDLALIKLTIDKMVDPSLDSKTYLKKIDALVAQIRALLAAKSNPTGDEKLEAMRAYLYDAGPWNHYQPFTYDLDHPEGTDISQKLISTYIDTRKGNCISMPILFAIIGQRLGLDVTLSTAPLHVFVKYTDHLSGVTSNIETTSGGHPARDAWLREQFPTMTDESIRNGVYMKRLSKQESAAVMARIVAEHFTAQRQYKKAVAIAETILPYYPADAELMIRIGSCYTKLIEENFAKKYPSPIDIPENQRSYYRYLDGGSRFYFAKAQQLGWRQPTQEEDQEYLNTVQKAKTVTH
jgi:regulator of sirC expression with transglutaminase-like and TPR domain